MEAGLTTRSGWGLEAPCCCVSLLLVVSPDDLPWRLLPLREELQVGPHALATLKTHHTTTTQAGRSDTPASRLRSLPACLSHLDG